MRYLILLLLPITLLAEELTTGNLIINGDFNNGTQGWTLSGDAQRINDCCPGGHDLEFGPSGSIEQSFDLINDPHITQQMLDQNPVTLNSTVEVQNGECGVAQCWGGSGPADSFSITLQIRDENSEVLATVTQERFNVTGINGKNYSDSLSYTGTGSNIGYINIAGSDSNNSYLGGPNVDNISVTMTYDDTVLSLEQTQTLATAFEEIEEVVEEIIFEPVELEVYTFEPIEQAEIQLSIPEEMSFIELEAEEINTGIVNVFSQEITEVSYGNQEELEEVSTEIEAYEERIEAEESSGPTTETENTVVEEETNTENSIEVAERQSETERENGGTSSGTEENVVGGDERESGESETGGVETTEVATGEQSSESNQEVSVEVVSVSDIAKQVERVVTQVDRKLVIISNIVARKMQNKNIQSYDQVNNEIFTQPQITDINIDEYTNATYVDIRNIYPNQTYEDRLWTSRQ
tara:strand:- start:382 stop:1779 length:1398 start_codon:yes stop_codon:yes gene_type:complete